MTRPTENKKRLTQATKRTKTHEFTLKYQLGAGDGTVDEIVERLGAGGCNDATIGVGQPGHIALQFTRDAVSTREALMSAVADVRRTLPAARLTEVVC